jgi:aspartate/methionine/tyrosine aminotransferase
VSTTHYPYYGSYSSSVQAAKGHFVPHLTVTDWSQITLQILTSPNNPDGQVSNPIPGSKYVVIDRVYDCPHFTGFFDRSVNGDNLNKVPMWYDSVTKSSGWPALRHGWIVVNEANTANALLYSTLLSVKSSIDLAPVALAQQMLVNFIRSQLDVPPENKFSFYHQLRDIFSSRQQELRAVIPEQYWLSATAQAPYFYMNIPASFFTQQNISVRAGTGFGETADKTRIMIMPYSYNWAVLIQRFKRIFASSSVEEMIAQHRASSRSPRITIDTVLSKSVVFSDLKISELDPLIAKLILQKYQLNEIPPLLLESLHELANTNAAC